MKIKNTGSKTTNIKNIDYFSTFLRMLNGVKDTLDIKTGLLTKNNDKTTGTTNSSSQITLTNYKVNSNVIVVDNTTGLYEIKTSANQTITTSFANKSVDVIYNLAAPIQAYVEISNQLEYLNGDTNTITFTYENYDEFTGNGSTKTFTLSRPACSTDYTVKVAGRNITSEITKGSTSITFTTSPKAGAIIEAYYNTADDAVDFEIVATLLEASGTVVTLDAITDVTINEEQDVIEIINNEGKKERLVRNKEYTITLARNNKNNVESFARKFKDKKFRLILENSKASNYAKDIAAVCEVVGTSKNSLEAEETITIKCTDFYEGTV
jgi:hypothetical protein